MPWIPTPSHVSSRRFSRRRLTVSARRPGPRAHVGCRAFVPTLLLACSLFATASAWADPPLFSPYVSVPLAPDTYPYRAVAADLNLDGMADLVGIYLSESIVSAFLGAGHGMFQPRVSSSLAGPPGAVFAGRIDSDPYPDVCVIQRASLDVLLGSGDGTFGAPVSYPADGAATGLVANVTGDGKREVTVLRPGSNALTLRTADGSGVLGAPTDVAVGPSPLGLAAGRLNGDTWSDLVVTNQGDNTISIFLGGATLGPRADIVLDAKPDWVALGDFDGDEILDLAVTLAGPARLRILHGLGDGTFTTLATTTLPFSPTSLAVGDFEGDGRLDAIVGASAGVHVLAGHGDGAFDAPRSALAAGSVSSVPLVPAVADFNLDERDDFAVASGDGRMLVALGQGDGTFGYDRRVAVAPGPWSLAAGDLDGDGDRDLAVGTSGAAMTLLDGAGDGTFTRTDLDVGGESAVVIGDLDHEGPLDLVVAVLGSRTFRVYLGRDGAPPDPLPPLPAGSDLDGVALADLDGDGNQDLVYTATDDDLLFARLGNGDGTFGPPIATSVRGRPRSVRCGDFDLDGRPDAVITEAASGLYHFVTVMLGAGDGTFVSGPFAFPYRDPASWADFATFGHDGIPDVVYTVPYGCGPIDCMPGFGVTLDSGNGAGGFAGEAGFETGRTPTVGAIADLDLDGAQDLALANAEGLAITLYLGGLPGSRVDFGLAARPSGLAFGDVNGDGRPDLLVANGDDASVSILLNGTGGLLDVEGPERHLAFALEPARPNPSAGDVELAFVLTRSSRAGVRVFDCAGRLIRTLLDGVLPAGRHTARWDGRTAAGLPAPAGVYHVAVTDGESRATRRGVRIR